jgi:hypothetical protein
MSILIWQKLRFYRLLSHLAISYISKGKGQNDENQNLKSQKVDPKFEKGQNIKNLSRLQNIENLSKDQNNLN